MVLPDWKPHLRPRDTAVSRDYTPVGSGGPDEPPPPSYPDRDRATHGGALQGQLEKLEQHAGTLPEQRSQAGLRAKGSTVTAEFDLNPDFHPETLEDWRGKGKVVLLTVQPRGDRKGVATIYVPEGQLRKAKKKVEDYLNPDRDGVAAPRGASTIQSIEAFRSPTGEDLWSDPYYAYPDGGDLYPWELWLRSGSADDFRHDAALLGIDVAPPVLDFPDRTVVAAWARVEDVERAVELLDCIAELRYAQQLEAEFHAMDVVEQAEWVRELSTRLSGPEDDAPAVCLLDTGVAWAHPLLEPSVLEEDCHAVGTWTPSDRLGHGTAMAGVALFGEDLGRALETTQEVELAFHVESVKVLEEGSEDAPLELRGAILREAPLHPEREAPWRVRSFSLTITGLRSREGRPTSWSAALDQVCAGVDEDEPQRLVFVSAGNHPHPDGYAYPEDNLTESVQDPAQSWNAVTVGAITHRQELDQSEWPGWEPLAPVGDLSPHTTTSQLWDKAWPNKPDMVMEGGNMASLPGQEPQDVDELGLLTTRLPQLGMPLLTSAAGTSPATVLAARYAAAISSEYPGLWPETVRALLIHSCRWTSTMKARCSEGSRRQKTNSLLRTFGYGAPDLQRARHSAGHALTQVVQDTLQPYTFNDRGKPATHELRLHTLPWPEQALEALGETTVRLRVTLSYFIEPGPGERGWRNRYRYPSHGLRFTVKTAEESDAAFEKRINKAMRTEADKGRRFPSDTFEWEIGEGRDRGSVHSDVWEGPASRLTGRGRVAVYPVIGWWRERKHLDQVERQARYALVVSLETDELEAEVEGAVVPIDLYTEVENMIEVELDA